jgi:hypothetical protein
MPNHAVLIATLNKKAPFQQAAYAPVGGTDRPVPAAKSRLTDGIQKIAEVRTGGTMYLCGSPDGG